MEEELQPSADDELVPLEALEPSDAEIEAEEDEVLSKELKRKNLAKGFGKEKEQDEIGRMLSEYCETPLLTREEEAALGHRILEGDEGAINEIALANQRLIVAIAKRFRGLGLEFTDLMNEGSIGLLIAAKKWDVRRGYRFSTYAVWWIRHGVGYAVLTKGRAIRLPAHIINQLYNMRKIEQQHYAEEHEKPSIEIVAKKMGLSVQQVKRLKQTYKHPERLDRTVGEKEEQTAGSLLIDHSSPQHDVGLHRDDVRATIMAVLENNEHITPYRREIFLLRAGMKDGIRHTKREIGALLNIATSKVDSELHLVQRVLSKSPTTKDIAELLDFDKKKTKEYLSTVHQRNGQPFVAPITPETPATEQSIPLYSDDLRITVLGALRNSTKLKASFVETFILQSGLENNERLSIAETARRLGISPDKARNRVRFVQRALSKDPTIAVFLDDKGNLKNFTTQHPDLR